MSKAYPCLISASVEIDLYETLAKEAKELCCSISQVVRDRLWASLSHEPYYISPEDAKRLTIEE